MNMNLLKASLSLAALGTFVVLSVATSPATFSQSAETEESNTLVTPDAPQHFVAVHTSEDARFSAIQLVARYRSFEVPDEAPENADADSNADAEVEDPIQAENAVRVLSQSPFDLEAFDVGLIQDTVLSRIELNDRARCDSDLCAGYAILTLEHDRGSDADLVLKLEGQWESLSEDAAEPTLELIPCSDDCQEVADAFLSDNLEDCALDDELNCAPPGESLDEQSDAQIEDAEQEQEQQEDEAQ